MIDECFLRYSYALFCFEALLGGVRMVELFFRGELNDVDLVDESFSFDVMLLSGLPLRSAKTCWHFNCALSCDGERKSVSVCSLRWSLWNDAIKIVKRLCVRCLIRWNLEDAQTKNILWNKNILAESLRVHTHCWCPSIDKFFSLTQFFFGTFLPEFKTWSMYETS